MFVKYDFVQSIINTIQNIFGQDLIDMQNLKAYKLQYIS